MFCQTQKVPITTESPAAIKMYLPRLIKRRARRAREGSAAHTLGGGNLPSPRLGCRQGTEGARFTRQRFSGLGFYLRGRSRRGGVLARK